MQSQAYRITGFAAVMGAVGFMMRWIQSMKIYDEATGLADRGAPINFWVIGILVVTLAALAVWTFRLRRFVPARDFHALAGRGIVYRIVGCFAGGVLALSGAVLLVTAGRYAAPALQRILAVLQLHGGVSAVLLTANADDPEKAGMRRAASVALVLFGCMFMVTVYKANAANPVVWSFAPEILALCTSTLALYYAAGYQFGQPKPFCGIFFSQAGVFLCMICVIDQGLTPAAAAYASLALLLGMYGFVQTENLTRPEA